jgi:hypothetical protein
MPKPKIPEGHVVKLVTDIGTSDIAPIHAVKAFGLPGMELVRGAWTVSPGTLCSGAKANSVSMVSFFDSMRLPHGEQDVCEKCLDHIASGKVKDLGGGK